MNTSVSISGVGLFSPLGNSLEEVWENILNSNCKIENGLGIITNSYEEVIKDYFGNLPKILSHENLPLPVDGKSIYLPTAAIINCFKDLNIERPTSRDGLIIATTTGGVSVWEKPLEQFLMKEIAEIDLHPYLSLRPFSSYLEKIKDLLGFSGPSMVVSSACSASTQAFELGMRWINSGRVDRVFVGGTEVLCDLTKKGFSSLKLLSEDVCKPFDQTREGINLSEGAAFYCLEKSNDKYAKILSGSTICDAHHMTAPHPEGLGMQKAVDSAIKESGKNTSDFSWIHAHGTGSWQNDISESKAMLNTFKEDCPKLSSTKALHGHALAASGAIEMTIILKALEKGVLTPSFNFENLGEKIEAPISNSFEKMGDGKLVLKSTLGFGGVNSCLVMQR